MRSDKGFILISVYLVLVLLLMMGGTLAAYAVAEFQSAQRSQAGMKAFYLTEAALDQGYQWLRAQAGPPGGTTPLVLNGGWQSLGEGQFLVRVDPADQNPSSYIKRYTVQGWGSSGDPAAPLAVRRSDLFVQVQSFAEFSYLTNSEIAPSGQRVWFITGDRIEGPAHTNGQFSMRGRPTFDGPVSSVSGRINFFAPPPAEGNRPNFNSGLRLNAPSKPLPTSIPAILVNAAAHGGTTFQGDTTITLLPDGNVRVTNAARRLSNALLPAPGNGVIYVNGGNLSLSGTVNGQMTVCATGDVRLTNSVLCADNPQTNQDSDDLLGILAGRSVVVARSAPMSLTVQASIMALNTSFIVENYWVGPPKGTLTVFGGINQSKRGPVGTFSGASGRRLSGYTKDYHYDQRLQNRIPPFFPLTGDYSTTGWDDQGI